MDIHAQRFELCVFCNHQLVWHYSTYTLDPKTFRSLGQGCHNKFFPTVESYVAPEDITMETKLYACPCPGFASILPRDEQGRPLPPEE